MNELPNFKANVTIDGFGETELHFLHQPSPAQDAVPLLFVHGWVGLWMVTLCLFMTDAVIAAWQLYRGDQDAIIIGRGCQWCQIPRYRTLSTKLCLECR